MATQLQDAVGRAAGADSEQVNPQAISLPADLQAQFQSTLEALTADRAAQRLTLMWWRQEPPREARRVPRSGPGGFRSGDAV